MYWSQTWTECFVSELFVYSMFSWESAKAWEILWCNGYSTRPQRPIDQTTCRRGRPFSRRIWGWASSSARIPQATPFVLALCKECVPGWAFGVSGCQLYNACSDAINGEAMFANCLGRPWLCLGPGHGVCMTGLNKSSMFLSACFVGRRMWGKHISLNVFRALSWLFMARNVPGKFYVNDQHWPRPVAAWKAPIIAFYQRFSAWGQLPMLMEFVVLTRVILSENVVNWWKRSPVMPWVQGQY